MAAQWEPNITPNEHPCKCLLNCNTSYLLYFLFCFLFVLFWICLLPFKVFLNFHLLRFPSIFSPSLFYSYQVFFPLVLLFLSFSLFIPSSVLRNIHFLKSSTLWLFSNINNPYKRLTEICLLQPYIHILFYALLWKCINYRNILEIGDYLNIIKKKKQEWLRLFI